MRQRAYLPPRLRELLVRGLHAGVLFVQAPAGYGKTAAILQFLLDERVEPRWYSCTVEDAEPAHLLEGLVRALGGAASPGGQTTLAALGSRDVRRAYPSLLKPLLTSLDEEGRADSVLVIDDADAVIDSPACLEILDYLISALSDSVRVILMSRAEIPLPSQAKRLLDGSAMRVVADDLRLREDEIAVFSSVAYGVQLAAEEVATLHGVTAGWAIALRLALNLRGDGTSLPRSGDRLFTPEARRDLFVYLAAEVLSRVDRRLDRFLRSTAVLDTLEPAVCAQLTDEERPAELIQSLAAAGLPVMKTGWGAYRCHSLLREYFLDAQSADDRRSANHRAGLAFAAIGDWAQALSYFASASDVESALSLADEHGAALFHTGRGRTLLDLVKGAPRTLLDVHYHAEYWAAMAASRLFETDWAIAAFERVYAAAAQRGDDATAFQALCSLTQVLNGWGRFAQANAVAQQLLDAVPEDDVARRAAFTIGFLITGMGGTDQFREAAQLTRRYLPDLLREPRTAPAIEGYARAVASVTLALEGDFAAARTELRHCDVLIAGIEHDEVTMFVPWSRALVEFLGGNAEGAEAAANAAETQALASGDLQRVLECRALRAAVDTVRGRGAEADRGFAQLDELRAGGTDFWGIILTMLSRPHRARLRGDLAAALAAAEENLGLATALSSARFSCSSRLDVAYLRLLSGDADAASRQARTALEEGNALDSDLMRYGANLMLAAASREDEGDAMREALRIADARDYRFLLPHAVRLPQLEAALYRALGTDRAERAGILAASAGPWSVPAARAVLDGLDEEAALRAVEVLRGFGSEGRTALRDLSSSRRRRVADAAAAALAALDARNPYGLSAREMQVLRMLAEGMRTKDIGERLVLAPATVSTHIQHIMNKTGTSSRAELISLALREMPDTAG